MNINIEKSNIENNCQIKKQTLHYLTYNVIDIILLKLTFSVNDQNEHSMFNGKTCLFKNQRLVLLKRKYHQTFQEPLFFFTQLNCSRNLLYMEKVFENEIFIGFSVKILSITIK